MVKKTPRKKMKIKKGDLVLLIDGADNGADKDMTGIVLETKEWPSEGAPMRDIYVHWSNGETYWCIHSAIKRIGRMLKKN